MFPLAFGLFVEMFPLAFALPGELFPISTTARFFVPEDLGLPLRGGPPGNPRPIFMGFLREDLGLPLRGGPPGNPRPIVGGFLPLAGGFAGAGFLPLGAGGFWRMGADAVGGFCRRAVAITNTGDYY